MTFASTTIDLPIVPMIGFMLISIVMMLLLGLGLFYLARSLRRLEQIIRLLQDKPHLPAESNQPGPQNQQSQPTSPVQPVQASQMAQPDLLPEYAFPVNEEVSAVKSPETPPVQLCTPDQPACAGQFDDQLAAAVQMADAEAVEIVLRDLGDYLQARNDLTLENRHQYVSAILDNLRQLLFDFDEDEAENVALDAELANRLKTARDVGEYLAVIRHLAALLLKNYQKRASQKKSDIVLQAKAFIEQNYQSALTVNAIAAALFISAPYLYRLMREEFGVSPAHYLNNLRLRHATCLLRDTAGPIAQIAAESGFETEQCFFRLFKKRMNCTPGQYRDRYRSV